jgi:hypothetical protein
MLRVGQNHIHRHTYHIHRHTYTYIRHTYHIHKTHASHMLRVGQNHIHRHTYHIHKHTYTNIGTRITYIRHMHHTCLGLARTTNIDICITYA